MWGDKFEESIKEKRKLLMDDTAGSRSGTPSKPTEQDSSKKMPKTASAAALDMFAEHTDMFNENFDVSCLRLFALLTMLFTARLICMM